MLKNLVRTIMPQDKDILTYGRGDEALHNTVSICWLAPIFTDDPVAKSDSGDL